MPSNLERINATLTDMSGKLGKLEANSSNLGRNFDRHCEEDDERHRQNLTAIEGLTKGLSELKDVVKPLAEVVARITPIVDGLQTRWLKATGAIGLALFILTLFGSLLTTLLGKAFNLLMAKLGLSV